MGSEAVNNSDHALCICSKSRGLFASKRISAWEIHLACGASSNAAAWRDPASMNEISNKGSTSYTRF